MSAALHLWPYRHKSLMRLTIHSLGMVHGAKTPRLYSCVPFLSSGLFALF